MIGAKRRNHLLPQPSRKALATAGEKAIFAAMLLRAIPPSIALVFLLSPSSETALVSPARIDESEVTSYGGVSETQSRDPVAKA